MLKLEVVDSDCGEGEAHMYDLPLDTPWGDIQTAVSLMHPDATSVYIGIAKEDTEG